MRAWELAKLLLDRCNSPQDVDSTLATLNDPIELQKACSLLFAFSKGELDNSPNTYPGHSSKTSTSRQKAGTKGQKELKATSGVEIVHDLEYLFRSRGMTNKQVEQWVNSNFNMRTTIGKGSLRKYLTKLLNVENSEFGSQLLSDVLTQFKENPEEISDIKDYWDLLSQRSIKVKW